MLHRSLTSLLPIPVFQKQKVQPHRAAAWDYVPPLPPAVGWEETGAWGGDGRALKVSEITKNSSPVYTLLSTHIPKLLNSSICKIMLFTMKWHKMRWLKCLAVQKLLDTGKSYAKAELFINCPLLSLVWLRTSQSLCARWRTLASHVRCTSLSLVTVSWCGDVWRRAPKSLACAATSMAKGMQIKDHAVSIYHNFCTITDFKKRQVVVNYINICTLLLSTVWG